MSEERAAYDALLFVSFGGPERIEDVMPFLENVVRGKNVPRERLEAVAEHYYAFGGRSPINDQCRQLIKAVEQELLGHDLDLPIYWGNRNWKPFLTDAVRQMRDDGVGRALAFVTSSFGSYSSCRQYRENIEAARVEVGEGAPEIHKLRNHFNHPGFIEAVTDRTQVALERLAPEHRRKARIAFTAHSIPVAMAETSPYVEQLEEACTLVAERVEHPEWQLVYQSRSGFPQVPWLEPDILEHLEVLAEIKTDAVVVVPIGFISDHMEVMWDLDVEAAERADELGIRFVRAKTPGTHPSFVSMIRELVEERMGRTDRWRALGSMGPATDTCGPTCCVYQPSRPTEARLASE